jgi:hypothetical protein
MIKNTFILVFIFFTVAGISQELSLDEIMKGDAFLLEFNLLMSVGPGWKKVYFEWNPNNELGLSTYFWEKGMLKPKLASSKEVFSRLDLKLNQMLI